MQTPGVPENDASFAKRDAGAVHPFARAVD